MIPSNMRSVPAEFPRKEDVVADGGTARPMSQQDSGCHGHEMHPQELVRLVGCHNPNAGKHDEAA
jgi:hypothetical protein